MLELLDKTFEIGGHTFTAGHAAIGIAVFTGVAVLGAVTPTIVMTVSRLAKAAFIKISDYFSRVPFFVRVKSLFCDDCAMRHREHVVRERESQRQQNRRLHDETITPTTFPVPAQVPEIGIDA